MILKPPVCCGECANVVYVAGIPFCDAYTSETKSTDGSINFIDHPSCQVVRLTEERGRECSKFVQAPPRPSWWRRLKAWVKGIK